jgi:hypothetical protein
MPPIEDDSDALTKCVATASGRHPREWRWHGERLPRRSHAASASITASPGFSSWDGWSLLE